MKAVYLNIIFFFIKDAFLTLITQCLYGDINKKKSNVFFY